MRIRRLALSALTTVGLVTALATPASATTSISTYGVWHWNVAGQKVHRNSTTDGLVPVAVGSVVNRAASLASFNELCWDQYKALQAEFLRRRWPADRGNFSRFEPTYPAGSATTCGGDALGNAIFSRYPLGGANRYTLPDDGKREKRKLLCTPLASRPRLRFCTTHITHVESYNGSNPNVNQLNYVLRKLEEFNAARDTVIIAGDFNAQPHFGRLNGWYSSEVNTPHNHGNRGRYRELDDNDSSNCLGYGEWSDANRLGQGPCGAGAKLDMVFVRRNRIAGSYRYSGDSLSISQGCRGPCSDHRILIGTVRVLVGA